MKITRFSLLLSMLCLAGSACVADAPLRVTDDLQREVTLTAPATRIVSLAPSITETLFAVGAASQIAGVTTYCTYPPEAKTKPAVGGITNPSIETIVSLRPDLILLSMEGNVREDFTKLQSLGIPMFVTNPRTLVGIHKSILDIGTLTGRIARARSVIQAMTTVEDSVRALASSAPTSGVYLFVSLQPIIVVGGSTFLNELLRVAGADNLAADAPSTYPTLSREAIVAQQPDAMLFMSEVLPDPGTLTTLYPEWGHLRAVQRGRVYSVDADIVSRPGPRAAEALKLIFQAVHAEVP
jgi:iron complex transport system substrate-binding protein